MTERNSGDRLDRMEKIVEDSLLNAHILLEQSRKVLLRSQVLLRDAQDGSASARNY
jgi:hypothetical protein